MIVVPSFIKFNFKEMVKFQTQEIIRPYSQWCKFCVSCQSILHVSKCLPLNKWVVLQNSLCFPSLCKLSKSWC